MINSDTMVVLDVRDFELRVTLKEAAEIMMLDECELAFWLEEQGFCSTNEWECWLAE